MGILSWILFGLIAGALAKLLLPGDQGGGIIITTVLGIVGAVAGGFVGTLVGFGPVTGFNVRSFVIAVAGALLVLWIYGMIRRRAR
jgi:uncharacterized membrane protein YeaQ/YmgE (transglycosylase-associated protein family)